MSRSFLTRVWVLIAVVLVFAACSGHKDHAEPPAVTEVPPEIAPPTSPPTIAPAPSTSRPAATVPAVRTYRVPASIPGDCSRDVTLALQAWVDHVPDGTTLTLASKACYRLDGTLTLSNRHHLSFYGNDAVLKAMTRGTLKRIGVAIIGGSDITVRHLTVWGANPAAGAHPEAYQPALVGQHGFKVGGATNVVLDHVQAFDVYGDFVYIGNNDRQPSSNITVSNSNFQRSGRQGITIVDGVNVTIESNQMAGAAKTMFDIEPNSTWQEARSIRIIGNVTGPAFSFWFANEGAHGNVGDIEISGNRMVSQAGGLIFEFANGGPYRSTYVIKDNQLIANDRVGDQHQTGALFFAHAENVTITGNHVTFPKGHEMPAVELRDTHHASVSGNTFTNAGPAMLATGGSSDYEH